MRLVGLTGGIGSGKTTVSRLLHEAGLEVIDADAITRQLQEPGQPTLAAMVEAFGPTILHPDGTLDRAGLARRVFTDAGELATLNRLVHPAVGAEIERRLARLDGTDEVVVLDVPLLVESGRDDLEMLVVVDLDPDIAVARLVAHRGFDERDARARIANQADRHERLRRADVVIENGGSIDDLHDQVEALLTRLTTGSAHTPPTS
jgi:dephospho-CoA kinase